MPAGVINPELENRSTAVVIATLVAVVLSGVYWVSRIGFDNPVLPVLQTLGVSLFLLAGPLWLSRLLRRRNRAWWTSQPVAALVCLVITLIAGLDAGRTGWSGVTIISGIGAILASMTFVAWLGRGSLLATLGLITGTVVFTVWCAGVIWGSRYKMPLFWETLAFRGNIHHDTFYYASMANMLDTYGVPSTGLDGIPMVHYHFGSAWLFAQWSHLLGMDVLSFYSLGYPLIVLPLFFSTVLLLAIELRKLSGAAEGRTLRSDWRVWIVSLAATVGFIPTAALDGLAVWNANAFISESYLMGMPVFFLAVAACVVFWRKKPKGISRGVFLLAFVPLMLAVSGFLKVSLMLLLFGAGIYLVLRIRELRTPLTWLAIVLSAAATGWVYVIVQVPAHNTGISPLHFMRFDAAQGFQQFFPLIHFLWTWVYVALRLRESGIRDFGSLMRAVRTRKLMDVEILLVIAVLGFLPGEIVSIHGGSAVYFSDVQRWLALSFITGRIALWTWNREKKTERGWRSVRLTTVLGVFVLAPFVATLFLNLAQWPLRAARANISLRRSLEAEASTYLPIVTALRDISRLPKSERRESLLFIPQSNRQYWSMFSADGRCTFTPFIAPGIASVAMLDGMPAYGCEVTDQYNMPVYRARAVPQADSAMTDAALCRRARSKQFRRVIVLDTPEGTAPRSRRIACYLQ